MRKKMTVILSSLLLVTSIFVFTACTENAEIQNEENQQNTSMRENEDMNIAENENMDIAQNQNMDIADNELEQGNGIPEEATQSMDSDFIDKSDRIAEEVEKIAEVQDAKVIVSQERALVGVKLTDEAMQDMEKMKDNIENSVRNVDSTIKTVVVSMDSEEYEKIRNMDQKVRTDGEVNNISNDFEEYFTRTTS